MLDMCFERGPLRGRSRLALTGQTEGQACTWVFEESPDPRQAVVLMPSVVADELRRDAGRYSGFAS